MKRFLFIDNFRGFANAYIPLVDVNFFVGENSSGKTSVLGLVKLFSNPRFLMGMDLFNDEDVNFGHFSDMVSAHSKDRTYFRIGWIDEYPGQRKGSLSVSGMLLTYRESSGIQTLSDLSCIMGDLCLHVHFEKKQISYRSQVIQTKEKSAESFVSNIFPQWIKEHSSEGIGYKKLSLPDGWNEGSMPLFVALTWAMQRSTKSKTKRSNRLPETIWFSPEVVWVAPIRTKPKRTYDEPQSAFSAEGSHTPYLIKRMLDSETGSTFRDFISKTGAASGLFQSIQIKTFGTDITAPFEVDAVLDEKPLNLSTVGYGVSQSLPIFVELIARPKESVFAIQQPEVHLHPRAQAALGDVFFEMAVNDQKRFLIETHSDFTIDRFRMNYRKDLTTKPDSQVLFFERRNKTNTVTALAISKNGELPANQPDSYRSFFVKEEMRILGL